MTQTDLLYFLIVIPILVYFTSFLTGWAKLAKNYRACVPYEGKLWRFKSLTFGTTKNYSNCIHLGANQRGLYLKPIFILRPGHPPLFIPWADIKTEVSKHWWIDVTKFHFLKNPGPTILIKKKLADQLLEQRRNF
jgi:hypothetical protein